VAAATAAALVLAACSSNTTTTPTTSPTATTPAATGTATGGGAAASIAVSDFNSSFSAMAKLKSVAAAGHGIVGVILPDTVTSTRYVEFDAPYLKQAFEAAGLTSDQFIIQNALGKPDAQVSDAQTDITKGATVLLVDPLDSGTGAHIESYAKAHGVAVIDYDRLTLGGTRAYYVSFDNVKVGEIMGHGLVSCVSQWGVKKPQVVFMKGDPTDNNATLFAQGSSTVLQPLFSSGAWTQVSQPAGTWQPSQALSEFQQQLTAHKNINAALIPNDENAAPIIHYLQNQGVKPKTFPTTGQDATLTGLQNILAGYQCGTVYKPIYLEAQGAVALALFLRAGQTPPASLVTGHVTDTTGKLSVPSVLLIPEWVTSKNMATTIVADKGVPVSQLCAGQYAAACKAAGIG
jgi:D-xylose transport system substrate-binding protein